ncbi:MAG: FtsX-like permease family protein, partial [Opitutaceae bacterium]
MRAIWLNDFKTASKHRLDGNFAIHRLVRHGLDGGKDFGPPYPRQFVDASESQVTEFRIPGQNHRMISARGDLPENVVAALGVFVVSSVALFLVALVAAASFVVVAQRRQRQLGMISALGATERHLRLVMVAGGAVIGVVAAVLGAALGVVGW